MEKLFIEAIITGNFIASNFTKLHKIQVTIILINPTIFEWNLQISAESPL